MADASKQSGAPEAPIVIPRTPKCAESCFSDREKERVVQAAVDGRSSQTHFTKPEADARLRWPLCDAIV